MDEKSPGLLNRGFFFSRYSGSYVFAIALRHFMHTFMRRDVPFTFVLMVRRLGKNILLLTLCACDTVEPDTGCFPHTSHVFDIEAS
jgi:hypothetical protein